MSAEEPVRVAVLTISDTAFRDKSADISGPTIRDILLEQQYQVKFEQIVPDEEAAIRNIVRKWSSDDADWIITTGGTGFGVRDRTPEAISPLIERQAPGIVHLLLASSLNHTPLAALARPVAGTIGNTLIVTLPGSVKAVRECMDALLSSGVVNHAVELIRGGSGKSVHNTLAAQAEGHGHHGHGHHHGHSHRHHYGAHEHHDPQPRTILSHDPSLPATARHRVSPYPLISFDEAMHLIMDKIVSLGTTRLPVTSALKGHVLAEDIFAHQDVPISRTTSVDGYALRSSDNPGVYRVVTPATHKLSETLPESTIYRINTGALLPAGTDTVIMVEDTCLVSSTKDEDGLDVEEQEVETVASVPAGENVREPGSDVKAGALVLQKGDLLRSTGGEIGSLAFVGRREVDVVRKPIVAVLSTGNELQDIKEPAGESALGWAGVWDTNRPSLQAALEGLGYEVVDLGIASDSIQAHVAAIKVGLEKADILLTTGGTSMGSSDLLKPVIEREFDGTIHFGRIKIKPGKPTTFATVPVAASGGVVHKPIFALPGNPASALVTFHVFVVPALRKLGGWREENTQFPRVHVKLHDNMRLDPRVEFHRVIIGPTKEGLVASSTGGQRSSRVASLNLANGLVILPERTEQGPQQVQEGDTVEAFLIGELNMV
ncbi:molybdenum cofactor biosynthesis protein [Gloeopeniophorella convolvens]|nr:molybdenum cofactor biosynthesis protein [Gloeopeniophorella convolvens]